MGVTSEVKRITWTIRTSDDQYDITFEPETLDTFSSIVLPEMSVRLEDIAGLIDQLQRIHEDMKRIDANEAGVATVPQGNAAR